MLRVNSGNDQRIAIMGVREHRGLRAGFAAIRETRACEEPAMVGLLAHLLLTCLGQRVVGALAPLSVTDGRLCICQFNPFELTAPRGAEGRTICCFKGPS